MRTKLKRRRPSFSRGRVGWNGASTAGVYGRSIAGTPPPSISAASEAGAAGAGAGGGDGFAIGALTAGAGGGAAGPIGTIGFGGGGTLIRVPRRRNTFGSSIVSSSRGAGCAPGWTDAAACGDASKCGGCIWARATAPATRVAAKAQSAARLGVAVISRGSC